LRRESTQFHVALLEAGDGAAAGTAEAAQRARATVTIDRGG